MDSLEKQRLVLCFLSSVALLSKRDSMSLFFARKQTFVAGLLPVFEIIRLKTQALLPMDVVMNAVTIGLLDCSQLFREMNSEAIDMPIAIAEIMVLMSSLEISMWVSWKGSL